MQGDIILDNFREVIRRVKIIPLIVIYICPKDYPNNAVGRIFDADKITPYIVLTNTIEQMREKIPQGMFLFPKSPDDDPVITETYM